MELSTKTDLLRIQANLLLDPKRKSSLGQFFTPAPICQFMASLFYKIEGEVQLLDSGCGVGPMIAAFTDEVLKRPGVQSLHVTGYDIEPIIIPFISETLRSCKEALENNDIKFTSEFLEKDFILSASDNLDIGFFTSPQETYSHVLMNPPYKKLNSSSNHRKAMSRIGIETVNLYTGFMALALKMLKPGGELVAIVPRSFCNGTYYQPFRELLLSETALKQIHVFDTRNNAFSEDDVLQENIILHCIKSGKQDKVKITSSPDAQFTWDVDHSEFTAQDMTLRLVDMDKLVKPGDKRKYIHIATTQREETIIEYMSGFNSSLNDLDIEISTGPVVGFRLKEDLLPDFVTGAAPLLYPIHLNGIVEHPKISKKTQRHTN